MSNNRKFYIDGAWVEPAEPRLIDVVDPSTEEVFTQIAVGAAADVDRAVAAAKHAFGAFSITKVADRRELLANISREYAKRYSDIADAVSLEMGAPLAFAHAAQAWIGGAHIDEMVRLLGEYRFAWMRGTTQIVKEAVGVVGMITPWNWPLNQIACKVAPAIAAGCTMVLKPSELSPVNAIIFAEVMHAAGVPAGVFNLVNGEGHVVGAAMSSHPDIDMMSFTGSTRAGIQVAEAAAKTVKRVHQELGGKSANILLQDADFSTAVSKGVAQCFGNSGQTCNAPTRMLVPAARHAEVLELARMAASGFVVGDPRSANSNLGPVVSKAQFDRIQSLIQSALDEGAELVSGGPGLPDGLSKGYYVKPTVFGGVTSQMRIAREEVFGPVLAVMPYQSEVEAIETANDSEFGLAAYVQSENRERAREVAMQMRAGTVYLNYPDFDIGAPFGGYKKSGNGREWAEFGLDDFLEIKGIAGYA